MDRLLRREFDVIACDHNSGAAELTLRAVKGLQQWLRRTSQPVEQDILAVARALLRVQPSMAPLLRLANEVTLAADTDVPSAEIRRVARDFGDLLRTANRKIAKRLSRHLAAVTKPRDIATYSYSSTVVAALIAARAKVDLVLCSESRPRCEGRATAEKLARAGIEVMFFTDAALMSAALSARAIVLGADAVLGRAFVNKIGTHALLTQAHSMGIPVLLLADSSKLCPEPVVASALQLRFGEAGELWRNPPNLVLPWNLYFEHVRFIPNLRVITEQRTMTPEQVRMAIKNIRISPRLRTLGD